MTFAGGLGAPLGWSWRRPVLVCTGEPDFGSVRAVLFFARTDPKSGEEPRLRVLRIWGFWRLSLLRYFLLVAGGEPGPGTGFHVAEDGGLPGVFGVGG